MKAIAIAFLLAASLPAMGQDADVQRGRYVVSIAGCNDCHTPGFAPKNGAVPESEWLTGDALGWRGPWGTTYATNLRLAFQEMTEDQWVAKAKKLTTRPPMPWFNVQRMSETDLRAVYRFVRHLGPAGKPAPAYVPPERKPQGPYVQFPEK